LDETALNVEKLAQISFGRIAISYAAAKEVKVKELVSISSLSYVPTPPSSPKGNYRSLDTGHAQLGGAALRQGPYASTAMPRKGAIIEGQGGLLSGSPSSPKLQSNPGSPPRQHQISLSPPAWETSDNNALVPRLSVARSKTASSVLIIEFPLVTVDLSKSALDGLQYWADDLAQLLERKSSTSPVDEEDAMTERGADSMIGSRFFTQSRGSSSARSFDELGRENEGKGDMVIKVAITEAQIRASVLRAKEGMERPFEILASDVDLILEAKPEGKVRSIENVIDPAIHTTQDETRITVDVMDLTFKDVDASGARQTVLSRSSSQSLVHSHSSSP
jgi:hypothetical protein